jgi:hypothetical protein
LDCRLHEEPARQMAQHLLVGCEINVVETEPHHFLTIVAADIVGNHGA